MAEIAYLNAGAIELPGVRAQTIDREIVGESARTAGGKLRRDVVTVKRVWRLELQYLTNAQYDAIVDYLDGILYGATTFWLDELGGTAAANSIAAYVDVEDDERVQFRDAAEWQNDGRNLMLIVQEQ